MRYSHPKSKHPCRAISLIEVMVVVAILGVLAGLLLPAISRAKDKRAQMVCINNIKQMVVATQLHASDNDDRLPWSNWLADDLAHGKPGWLYTINTNAVGPDRFHPESGLFWKTLGEKPQMYKCPLDLKTHPEFHNRGQQISSYVMNGAVNRYKRDGFGDFRFSDFHPEDVLFWETDEAEPRFFNDGASRPDEGVSPRHGKGAIMGAFGGNVELVKFRDWYAEVARTNRNHLWCIPSEPDGRGPLPPILY